MLLLQRKLFSGTLPETGKVLTLNTKDHDDRHTFIAAALYAWSENLAGAQKCPSPSAAKGASC